MLLKCGDPEIAEVGATFSTDTSANGWFCMPDNCAVDSLGRLWVSTDGNNPSATGRTDGLWAVDTGGDARATSKLFFRVPVGDEMCGPLFTHDDETAFVAVQHPVDGGDDWARCQVIIDICIMIIIFIFMTVVMKSGAGCDQAFRRPRTRLAASPTGTACATV